MNMERYLLKPMTESSWILHKDGVRLALVTERNGQLAAMGKLGKSQFKDVDDLAQYLNARIEVEQPAAEIDEEILGDIQGYPIKHQAVIPIEHASDLPLYRRGKTEHAAGFYGVKFKNGWVHSFCPKSSTLTENDYIGPFRTKLEMQNAISQKKREITI